MLKNY